MPRPLALAVAMALAAPTPALAQEPPRVRVGAGVGIDLMVGDASDFLDGGATRFLMAAFRLDSRDRLHLRLEGTSTPLDEDEDPVFGTTASNHLVTVSAGPQISGSLGPLRPHAAVLAGVAVGFWSMEVDDDSNVTPPADDDGFESAFGFGGTAGLGYTLDEGDLPIVLFVEGRIFDVGALLFARTPSFQNTNEPFGLTEADAAVLSLRAGVTLGF